MASHVPTSLLCRTLIGRDAYLTHFAGSLASAAEGRGGVIAISGEAGIGKSRLVTELRALAQANNPPFDIAQGNCFEFDTVTPFAPLVDLFRDCLHSRSPEQIRECTAPDAPALLRIIPELAALLPGVEAAPSGEPEQDKRQIFAALTRVFSRLASSGPFLMIIEDMHWCDDTTMEFLGQFARNAASSPILIVVDFRADDMDSSLRKLLASLDRQRIVTDWPLMPLSQDEVGAMLVAMLELAQPLPLAITARIHALTEGNPFFIEEVLKSLTTASGTASAASELERMAESSVGVPRSVRAAVHDRIEQLSETARHIVELAAVTGRRFDFTLLARLSSLSEEQLLTVIKELIAAQLVVEESAEHFVFRHALTQQAIYGELLVRERRTIHERIGEALQSIYSASIEVHLPELAHHYRAAEAWDEAYFYCRRAGERALTLNSPGAAAEQLTRAIESASHLGVKSPASLYRSRGQSREALGDFAGARADFEQAFQFASEEGDGRAEWQSLIDLGFLWSGRDYDRSGQYFQHAHSLAEKLADQTLQAQSLNRVGNWLANIGRPAEGVDCHQQALAIFEELQIARGRAETLDLLGMCYGLQGDCPASAAAYRDAVVVWRGLDDKVMLASVLASRATWCSPAISESTHMAQAEPDEMLDIANEAIRMADETGSLPCISFARFVGAGTHTGYGRFCEAIEDAAVSLQAAEEAGHKQWLVAARFTLGQAHLYACSVEEAIRELDSAVPFLSDVGSAWWTGNVRSHLARARLQQGDLKAARQVLSLAWPADNEPQNHGQRRVALTWAQLAHAEGRPDDCLARVERLIASTPGAGHEALMPFIRHVQGDALAALGRDESALRTLEHARDDAIATSATIFLWPIYRSIGRLHAAARRSDEARHAFQSARAVIGDIAANLDEGPLRARFLERSHASLPAEKAPTANQAARAASGGLTAREREVATLIAHGKSNRDIAEALVLGERTIETHVGNILSKLDFSSRSQIAAWAIGTGLAELAD